MEELKLVKVEDCVGVLVEAFCEEKIHKSIDPNETETGRRSVKHNFVHSLSTRVLFYLMSENGILYSFNP